ncbi:MAG: 16S rRNA (adenine(1518)-N(6)/adenine(1519)-N(6))-dimethyltransferase RsmA [Verrucomicrobiales bacterium]
MTETELKEVLDKHGVLPSKKLGQNFLVDENTARWIVGQLELKPEDTVVEVGPGAGALTEHVVGQVRRVILVEYDRRLAGFLAERFAGRPEVEVVHADAVKFDLRPLFAEGPVKFLGNLPYSAGGAILRNFLKQPTPVSRAVLMLQKEMIDRIQASPEDPGKDYGVLSLRMQVDWDCEAVKVVPPGCFYPRPQIDSTVMRVDPRAEELPVYDRRLFDELVRRGFSQRRKQLHKNLPSEVDWEAVSAELGLEKTVRAEELGVRQWVALTRLLDPLFVADEGQKAGEMLAVVDENDVVTGAERRDVVHERGLRHRAVHLFVLNKKGEVFLQKRSRLKDKCPGLWDSSAAGHVDAGEDYGPCARRELEEELGLTVEEEALREVGRIAAAEDTGWEFVRLYALRAEGALRFPCVEIECGEWFSMADTERWVRARPEDFAPGFVRCWELWREANPGVFGAE